MPDIPLNMNDLMMFIDAAQKILINFLKSINIVGQLSSRGGMLINQQLVLYRDNNEPSPKTGVVFRCRPTFGFGSVSLLVALGNTRTLQRLHR